MGTANFPKQGEMTTMTTGAPRTQRGAPAASWRRSTTSGCALMGLLVRSHRRLTDLLGRELEQSVGIPLVWFDVLIHIGGGPRAAPDHEQAEHRGRPDHGGVTRLVDRMVEAGLVARQNCPSRSAQRPRGPDPGRAGHTAQAIGAHIEGIDRHLVAPLDETDRAALEVALSKLLRRSC